MGGEKKSFMEKGERERGGRKRDNLICGGFSSPGLMKSREKLFVSRRGGGGV